MATISNFGQLKAACSTYMRHAQLSPNYDLATQNFENAANRRLRVLPMEAIALITTTGGAASLPADYGLWRAVLWVGQIPYDELEYVHPAYLNTTGINARSGGNPAIFSIINVGITIYPPDDRANIFHLHYYQKIPTIIGTTDGDNASNWLISSHSDAYLYGVLCELFILGRNMEEATLYKQRRDEAFQEIIQSYALTTGATSSKVRGEAAEYF